MKVFESVDKECKRTMFVRKSNQNVPKSLRCLTIASSLGQVGQFFDQKRNIMYGSGS